MAHSGTQQSLTKHERIRIIISAIAAFCLLAAAAATWYFRNELFGGESIVLTIDQSKTDFNYDPGNNQSFAAVGDDLAVLSGSGFSLLDAGGSIICSQSAAFENPAAESCSRYAVFFDQGEKTLYFADTDGSITPCICSGDIISAHCSASGHLALVTREAGWRALVTVFDSSHSEVYRWYSAENYVLSARISPDGRSLAVLCLNENGSEIRFFSLTSEEQKAVFSVSDTVLIDFFWLGSGRLCAFSTESAVFFSSAGTWTAAYDFQNQYLTSYDAGSNFICFALSAYRSGSSSDIVCLNSDGDTLSVTSVESEILSLDADGGEFLLLNNTRAELYNANGAKRGTLNDVAGFKQALIRNKGEALLLAAGFAEVYKF